MKRAGLFGLGVFAAVVACSEPSAPRRQIAFTPSDTTVDIGEVLYHRVVDQSRPDTALTPGDDYVYEAADPAILDVHVRYRGILPLKEGTTTVQATLRADPRVKATMTVRVRPSRVYLTNFPTVPIEVGTTMSFDTRYPGGKNNNAYVSSSNPAVASIQQSNPEHASMTAVAPGTATVTVVAVDDTTKRVSYPVTVVAAVAAKIEVSPTSVQLHGMFDSVRVLVTLTNKAGQLLTDRIPAITSGDRNVAVIGSSSGPTFRESFTYGFYVRSEYLSGSTTLRIESGNISAVIPVRTFIAGPDSAYVNAGGTASPYVLANDAATTIQNRPNVQLISIAQAPKHGSATIASTTNLKYDATPGYLGVDTVRYVVRDPSGATDTGTVKLNVIPGPYSVTTLEFPGALSVSAVALNNRGQVAATIGMPDGRFHAARWDNGRFTLLDDPPGGLSVAATAINDVGDVIGYAASGSLYGYGRPVLWRAGATAATMLYSDTTQDWPVDINNRGQILLGYLDAHVYESGKITTLSSYCTTPIRLTNTGVLFGRQCSTLYPSFVVSPPPAGGYSGCSDAARYRTGEDINDSLVVVGYSEDLRNGDHPVCIFRPGVRVSDARLTFGAWLSLFNGTPRINNRGWITWAVTLSGRSVPALLLNDMAVPISRLVDVGGTLTRVNDINDRGQMIGTAELYSGARVSVLLSPPASVP